jgi:hypothetical protein
MLRSAHGSVWLLLQAARQKNTTALRFLIAAFVGPKWIGSHGRKANRATLELAAKYSNQQNLTQRVMTLEELLAPNALGS